MGEPNVLMLDEPTNDLDTDTLAAVEDVLDGWPGTLVVVSHDRYLLERVTDTQMALLGDGKLRDLPGGVDQYLELREAALASGAGGGSSSQASRAAQAGASRPDAAGRGRRGHRGGGLRALGSGEAQRPQGPDPDRAAADQAGRPVGEDPRADEYGNGRRQSRTSRCWPT